MKHDLLADVLYVINNAENIGKRNCIVPASSLVKDVLTVMHNNNFIGSFEFIDDGKSGHFKVDLIGRINKSRVIRPRFAMKKDESEKWEIRYLPARGFGLIIVSTPKGVMSQADAVKNNLGGRLLGYVY